MTNHFPEIKVFSLRKKMIKPPTIMEGGFLLLQKHSVLDSSKLRSPHTSILFASNFGRISNNDRPEQGVKRLFCYVRNSKGKEEKPYGEKILRASWLGKGQH